MPGAFGEASNLYLIPEGAYVHPLYNDFNGNTDKLLTTSLKAGLLREHFEIVYFWRLFTPSVKPAFLRPALAKPVGRYADWMEVEGAYAHRDTLLGVPVKHQVMLGLNHIGDKGGKKVHRWVHKATRNSLENLEYTNQPAGAFATAGYEIAFEDPIYQDLPGRLDQQVALVTQAGQSTNEAGIRHNLLLVVRKPWWEVGTELKIVRQYGGKLFESMRPYRLEASAGTLLYGWFTPTVKYVSPYLFGDDIGQTYFDFLHYNAAF